MFSVVLGERRILLEASITSVATDMAYNILTETIAPSKLTKADSYINNGTKTGSNQNKFCKVHSKNKHKREDLRDGCQSSNTVCHCVEKIRSDAKKKNECQSPLDFLEPSRLRMYKILQDHDTRCQQDFQTT